MPLRRCWCLCWGSGPDAVGNVGGIRAGPFRFPSAWGCGAVCVSRCRWRFVVGGLYVRSSGGGWRRRGRPNTANTVSRLRCGAGGIPIRCRIVAADFWNPTRRRPARGLWPGCLPLLLYVIVRGLGRPICRTFRRFQWPCRRILERRGNACKCLLPFLCVRGFRKTTNQRFYISCIRRVCAMPATCGRSGSGRRSCGPLPRFLGFVKCGVVVAG